MTRRIDHLVLAVHDLDAAAVFYEKLGFQVGARNRHPWGTENRLVQFQSSFLELITVGMDARIEPHGKGRFSFGAFVRDYLARGEGLAMLVLDSEDARADAEAFAKAKIGEYEPFFFERKGRRPDGFETHVAFTLAFAMDEMLPETAFFVCEQHFPEAFWNSELQVHANGASNLTKVTLGVGKPASHSRFLSAFTGVEEHLGVFYLARGGRLRALPSARRGLTGFTVQVQELGAMQLRLRSAGIDFAEELGALVIAPEVAFGTSICFSAR